MARRLQGLLPPSRSRLVRAVGEELRAQGVDPAGIAYDDATFRYRLPDGTVVYLGNLFHECQMLWPWQRRAHVRRFVRLFADRPAGGTVEYAEAEERLLPGVRDALILDVVRLHSLNDGQEPMSVSSRPLGTRLCVCLFVDSPESTMMVTDKHLGEWGKTFDQALEVALRNLEARSPGTLKRHESVYVAPWSDCYDPARALLPARMSGLDVQGDRVAFMPNWNNLLVTGADDVAGLAGALAFARRVVEEEPRGMSALPLVLADGEWIDFELPRGHALEPALREARVMELSRIYSDQTEQLRRHHDTAGIDVFVAAYTGVRRAEDGDYSSYCVWSKDVVTLLPRTETVSFFDADAGENGAVVAQVDWDLMRLHCSGLLQPTDWSQQRFRVDAFPSADQLEAMRRSQAQRDAGRRPAS
jgi:hypothetical protein